ncbi:sulfurtransferase TusA family protein [Acinetobacter sp. MD2(2019)]|uniref:sulfurtransferase TusA family protein n=1 Tax=Acinetobacter sp. MD2(2019) TaxID=2605273 RepID=UPI002D1F114B|nr:sulfurtransferase TusA family protein [Acinetobacter sp. MD2(2019)]MEB3753797.1 sulfurtransferase TusA family protein [Acinetobacter sp. MD2(2019)]
MSHDLSAQLALIEIDALEKPCPMPLLMLKRAIKSAVAPSQFYLKASDPSSEIDILRYCQLNHLDCKMTKVSNAELHFLIKTQA